MCRAIRAVALIDDAVAYVQETAEALPLVVLFGSYAWQRLTDGQTLNAKVGGRRIC
jgi:hypothetical protein